MARVARLRQRALMSSWSGDRKLLEHYRWYNWFASAIQVRLVFLDVLVLMCSRIKDDIPWTFPQAQAYTFYMKFSCAHFYVSWNQYYSRLISVKCRRQRKCWFRARRQVLCNHQFRLMAKMRQEIRSATVIQTTQWSSCDKKILAETSILSNLK